MSGKITNNELDTFADWGKTKLSKMFLGCLYKVTAP